MQKTEISELYGAAIHLQMLLDTERKELEKRKNGGIYMPGAEKIIELFEDDLKQVQSEITMQFMDSLTNLSKLAEEMQKQDEEEMKCTED